MAGTSPCRNRVPHAPRRSLPSPLLLLRRALRRTTLVAGQERHCILAGRNSSAPVWTVARVFDSSSSRPPQYRFARCSYFTRFNADPTSPSLPCGRRFSLALSRTSRYCPSPMIRHAPPRCGRLAHGPSGIRYRDRWHDVPSALAPAPYTDTYRSRPSPARLPYLALCRAADHRCPALHCNPRASESLPPSLSPNALNTRSGTTLRPVIRRRTVRDLRTLSPCPHPAYAACRMPA